MPSGEGHSLCRQQCQPVGKLHRECMRFGLGRYGDSINPEGCFECFANIQKKMKKGGRLYISVPIGMERIEFNAHRVFFASTIVDSLSSMQLKEFSCVAERKIEYDVEIHKYDNDLHNGEHRYGLFLFEK